MDILAQDGWISMKSTYNDKVVVSTLREGFLNGLLCKCNIAKFKIKKEINAGYRVWSAIVTKDEALLVLMEVAKFNETSSSERRSVYNEARFSIFNRFSFPVDGSVTLQETAMSAIASSKCKSWSCRCGRKVPLDGLPCICGEKR